MNFYLLQKCICLHNIHISKYVSGYTEIKFNLLFIFYFNVFIQKCKFRGVNKRFSA